MPTFIVLTIDSRWLFAVFPPAHENAYTKLIFVTGVKKLCLRNMPDGRSQGAPRRAEEEDR